MSECDVYWRQILTSKLDRRTVRVKVVQPDLLVDQITVIRSEKYV